MTKNPLINALAAAAYITVVGSGLFLSQGIEHSASSFVVPIAMISLLTLSVAVMGYCFLAQPLQLLIAGQKAEAVRLIVKTLLIFGAITALLFIAAYLTATR
ncbi:hypothetical protein HZB60_02405 [candidate division KSB1 bacterium]|nr:hypothetical protein [candidate division KSB1 bacterium]